MDHPPRPRWRIDVKTISCRGVKSFIPFQKPSLYALLSLVRVPSDPKNHGRHHDHDEDGDDDDEQQQRRQHKTPVDLDGGENPEWDHPMHLSFSSPRADRLPPLLLRFDVAAHNIPLLGDKVLASAQVPLAHLLNAAAEEESPGATPAGALRHLSYELRGPDGKPNGILAFAFRITNPLSGGIADHGDPGINVGAPVSACAPQWQYSPPPNVVLYPPLDPAPPYYPPPEIYPPPPPPSPLFPEPLYPPPGTRFPFQAHDLELYPPPSAPAHVACYPPQDPGCCHATPRGTYGCPTDGWDRRGFYGGSS